MAVWITADNVLTEVKPAKGKAFRLEELQHYVGGYIEPVYLQDGRVMWVNEEGKLKNFPYNAVATDMARRLTGLALLDDSIVGNVLVATREESGEDEEEEGDD